MNLTQEFTKLRYIYNQFGETLVGIETMFGTQKPSGRTTGVTGGQILNMPQPKKHNISKAGRARIAAAARARWAKTNGARKAA